MEEQKVTSFFRFEDLRVYSKALEYYKWLATEVKTSDEFARKALLMPFLDSAARIAVNIAEGSSSHKSQFIEYLKLAKSSVRQCVVFTSLALDSGFFTQDQYDQSRTTLIEMTKMVGAMIVSLQKGKDSRNRYSMSGGETSDESVQRPAQGEESPDFNNDFSFNY